MKLIKGGKKEPVVEKDHSNHWRIVVPNPDHSVLFNKKRRRKASAKRGE